MMRMFANNKFDYYNIYDISPLANHYIPVSSFSSSFTISKHEAVEV